MPAGLLLTRPPAPSTSTCSASPAPKLAFTLRLAVIVTAQAALPVHAPDQEVKEPSARPAAAASPGRLAREGRDAGAARAEHADRIARQLPSPVTVVVSANVGPE